VKRMSDNTRNTIESLEEYKKGLLRSIAIGIQARNRDDDYSVGLRNGLRVCKAYIDGLEPEYEKCKPSAEILERAVRNTVNLLENAVELVEESE